MEVKLTDICDIQYGYAFDSEQFSETEGTPLIRIRDVVRGFSETRTTESFPPEYAVHNGDILIGMDGEFNTARWHGGTAALNQRVCRLIPKKVDADYIFHFMPTALKAIEAKTPFVTVKHLSAKELNRITVPFPSLTEQMRIGTILNRVLHIIEMRKQELQFLDNLIKVRFVEMFGAYTADCCTKRFCDYAQVLGGYAFKSDAFIQDAIPIIRISNINEGRITPDSSVCFSEEFWHKNPKYRATSGDILMAMSGATTGKAGILRSNEKFLINQRVACIRAKEGKSLPEFIYAATQLPWIYDLIQEESAGCAQPNISGKQIENLPIPKATFIQQKQFAAFVAQIDKTKAAVQKALDKAQLLFDSLMQQYFG